MPASMLEPILDAELPIIDAHHHLWFRPESLLLYMEQESGLTGRSLVPVFRRHARYLFDEYLADLSVGHNIRASVFIEASTMYRQGGPEEYRSVGEVEFANGMAAIAASGALTGIQICAAIVGSVDLRLGSSAEAVLEAHIQAGGGRYRGVRAPHVAFDANPVISGRFGGQPHLLLDRQFREGFRLLARFDLSYDAWQLEYQLKDLVDLAKAFPETRIIVNHMGGLFGIGPYEGKTEQRFSAWKENILALATCDNVVMKLGGLGMPVAGVSPSSSDLPLSSEVLARDWRPYIETCIEAFGVHRCMFESNFPVDAATTGYLQLWNAFKRVVHGASLDEKKALFSDTAAQIYNIEIQAH